MQTSEARKDRYLAEAELLRRAGAGDALAANSVLQYLSSANADLRGLMLASLHDCTDPLLWFRLLRCLAVQRWGASSALEGAALVQEPVDCERRVDPDASERIDQAIAAAFSTDENPEETPIKTGVLSQALVDPDERVRIAAAYLLGLRGDPAAIPTLAQALDCASLAWQRRAIHALGQIHDVRSGPPLVHALAMRTEPLHHDAQQALNTLGLKAQPALLDALHHPQEHVRWHAARMLGQLGDAQAVDILAAGLCDENRAVRWATARVLAQLDLKAVPAILHVLSTHPINEPLREAALHALHTMSGRQARDLAWPVISALRGPAANVEAAAVAQKLLAEWEP